MFEKWPRSFVIFRLTYIICKYRPFLVSARDITPLSNGKRERHRRRAVACQNHAEDREGIGGKWGNLQSQNHIHRMTLTTVFSIRGPGWISIMLPSKQSNPSPPFPNHLLWILVSALLSTQNSLLCKSLPIERISFADDEAEVAAREREMSGGTKRENKFQTHSSPENQVVRHV